MRKENRAFQKEYKKILEQVPEYSDVTHTNIKDRDIAEFFLPKELHKKSVENYQSLNLEGLQGRLQSSSYFPKRRSLHEKLIHDAETLFYKFEKDGVVTFLYDTNIYWSGN